MTCKQLNMSFFLMPAFDHCSMADINIANKHQSINVWDIGTLQKKFTHVL